MTCLEMVGSSVQQPAAMRVWGRRQPVGQPARAGAEAACLCLLAVAAAGTEFQVLLTGTPGTLGAWVLSRFGK